VSPQKHHIFHLTEANLSQYSDYAIGYMTEGSRIDSRQEQDCFLLKSVQTSSGAQPTSYSLCTEDSLLGIKLLRHEAGHPPPPSTKLRNKWNFLFNKTNRSTNFSKIYFCQETLRVSYSSSAHHQEFSTVHSALVNVMQVSWHLPVLNVQ